MVFAASTAIAAVVAGTASASDYEAIPRGENSVIDKDDMGDEDVDLEEALIEDDEVPRTVADFVQDSTPTSSDAEYPLTVSGGPAVSGSWTGKSSG